MGISNEVPQQNVVCCVTAWCIPFHSFYFPIASHLCSRNSRFLGCLLSLLGFLCSPVSSQKNRKLSMSAINLSLSQHCKSFPRSGMECIPADFSSIFTIPWGDFYRDSRTVCDKNTMEECKKRPLSAATIFCQHYSVLHTNIQIKSKQKTHKKSYKTRSSPRV